MRGLAVNAALRTVLQGVLVTAAVAAWAAARSAATGGPVDWAHVGLVAAQAAVMAVVAYLGRALLERHITALPVNLDALVRAGRTLLAGAAATVLTAAYQAITVAVGHGTYDPATLARTAAVAAAMAAVAWAHRLLLDGLPVPTAAPPAAAISDVYQPLRFPGGQPLS